MARPRTDKICSQREFSIVNLLVRIHFIIVMIGWTGLAPWEFNPNPKTQVLSSAGDSAQLEMARRKTDKIWAATFAAQRAKVETEKLPDAGFWSNAAPK